MRGNGKAKIKFYIMETFLGIIVVIFIAVMLFGLVRGIKKTKCSKCGAGFMSIKNGALYSDPYSAAAYTRKRCKQCGNEWSERYYGATTRIN